MKVYIRGNPAKPADYQVRDASTRKLVIGVVESSMRTDMNGSMITLTMQNGATIKAEVVSPPDEDRTLYSLSLSREEDHAQAEDRFELTLHAHNAHGIRKPSGDFGAKYSITHQALQGYANVDDVMRGDLEQYAMKLGKTLLGELLKQQPGAIGTAYVRHYLGGHQMPLQRGGIVNAVLSTPPTKTKGFPINHPVVLVATGDRCQVIDVRPDEYKLMFVNDPGRAYEWVDAVEVEDGAPKFKVGDRVTVNGSSGLWTVTNVSDPFDGIYELQDGQKIPMITRKAESQLRAGGGIVRPKPKVFPYGHPVIWTRTGDRATVLDSDASHYKIELARSQGGPYEVVPHDEVMDGVPKFKVGDAVNVDTERGYRRVASISQPFNGNYELRDPAGKYPDIVVDQSRLTLTSEPQPPVNVNIRIRNNGCEECKGSGEYVCPITAKRSPCSKGCQP